VGVMFRASSWSRVEVAGQSMMPALSEGDWLLCRAVRGQEVRPGQIVVAEQPNRLGFLLVKRAIRRVDGGWWLEGDNPGASDDSRTFGPVADGYVRAVASWRYWPSPRRLSS
jgi:nickel-type superoxide dismutase maturation protease